MKNGKEIYKAFREERQVDKLLKLSAKITKHKQQLLNYQTKQAPKKIVEQSFKECKRSRQTIVLSIDNISMTHDSLILQQIKKLWVSPHNKQNLQALVEIAIYRYNKPILLSSVIIEDEHYPAKLWSSRRGKCTFRLMVGRS